MRKATVWNESSPGVCIVLPPAPSISAQVDLRWSRERIPAPFWNMTGLVSCNLGIMAHMRRSAMGVSRRLFGDGPQSHVRVKRLPGIRGKTRYIDCHVEPASIQDLNGPKAEGKKVKEPLSICCDEGKYRGDNVIPPSPLTDEGSAGWLAGC